MIMMILIPIKQAKWNLRCNNVCNVCYIAHDIISYTITTSFWTRFMLNITHDTNWKLIKERKQKLIRAGNVRENRTRIAHDYKIGDKVLIKNEQSTKYGNTEYSGSYTVMSVNNNGTLQVRKGIVSDTFNIRNVHPYKE